MPDLSDSLSGTDDLPRRVACQTGREGVMACALILIGAAFGLVTGLTVGLLIGVGIRRRE